MSARVMWPHWVSNSLMVTDRGLKLSQETQWQEPVHTQFLLPVDPCNLHMGLWWGVALCVPAALLGVMSWPLKCSLQLEQSFFP